MKRAIIKNPDELQIISNPQQSIKTIKTMANKNLSQFKDQALMAGLILLGQASAATANSIVSRNFLSGYNAILQQAAKVALPAATGLAFAASKNKKLYPIGLGMGVQSTLELIRFVIPGVNPQDGFANPSGFVHSSCACPKQLPAHEEAEQIENSGTVNGQAEFISNNAYMQDQDSIDWFD